MRWETQSLDAGGDELPGMPALKGLVRSVRTPEFAGITFHEVRAKSVLNRVPGPSPMPFSWTINPYRGCSHQCTYCLAADTLVLMGDGRAIPIAEVRVGDLVYGTTREGRVRRYVRTRVEAVRRTTKPAWRVSLADGTELVASAAHRFLTERGWRHVAAQGCSHPGGPRLTTSNTLLGTGALTAGPKHDADYRRGYLTGVIRGRAPGDVPRLRPAPAAPEALARVREFLADAGVPADGIGGVEALVRWPAGEPGESWTAGFLAGLLDAGASCSRGSLRIGADEEILVRTTAALARLGFRSAVERGPDRVTTIRVLGGAGERLRMFQVSGPAGRGVDLEGTAVENARDLGVRSVQPLGFSTPMVDLTTGTGDFIANGVVSHNCFARNTHTYLDLDAGDDFDRQVVVKLNAPEVVARELRAPRWNREHVAMGTNTDPYQRAEGRYALMPGIIRALAGSGTPFSILTKGTLLSRDLPDLTAAARDVPVGIGVSLALLDPDLQRRVEPGTPSPRARLDLVRRIRDAGLPCGVFVAPVLPGLTDTDEALDALLREIADAGATGASVLALHLRPGTREWFHGWLTREHPELLERYAALYRRGAYVDAAYRRDLAARVAPLLAHHGLEAGGHRTSGREDREAWPAGSTPPVPAPIVEAPAEQLTLL